MDEFIINIAKDFSPILGGRWTKLGQFSGEQFYNDLLSRKFQDAVSGNQDLHIYLDGTKGYGSSFLDQSFGELARIFGLEKVKKTIVFHTEYSEWVVKYINEEIWQKK
jgi:hypothetical protein